LTPTGTRQHRHCGRQSNHGVFNGFGGIIRSNLAVVGGGNPSSAGVLAERPSSRRDLPVPGAGSATAAPFVLNDVLLRIDR
jgi:hypothetical protein